ncbi:hypothetical protein ScPMuIL_007816 [Solemya velum]
MLSILKTKRVFVSLLLVTFIITIILMFCLQYLRSSDKSEITSQLTYDDSRLKAQYDTDSPNTGKNDSDIDLSAKRWDRIEHLQQVCKNYKKNLSEEVRRKPKLLNHILVNDEHKLLYCYIPKVACTNLKRIFLILSGKMNTTNLLDLQSNDVHHQYNKYLTYLSDFSFDEAMLRLKNYKKVVYVREPFERILSAYVNKFEGKNTGNDYFKLTYGKKIIKYFRDEPYNEDLKTGEGVQFSEFVQFLNDPLMQINGYNEHWAHFHTLCLPCYINYDFIGKYETLEEDVNYWLHTSNLSHIINFPKRSATYRKSKTVDLLLKYYKSVPKRYLHELLDTYHLDYKLFGYPYPSFI